MPDAIAFSQSSGLDPWAHRAYLDDRKMHVPSPEGKVAVVTRGLGMMGRQQCQALAHAGAHVVVCDLDGEESWALAEELPTHSIGIGVDVTDPHSVRTMLEIALLEFDCVDVLVNNVAIDDECSGPALTTKVLGFDSYPPEMWKKSLDVNVTSVFLCSQVVGKQMVKQGQGSIINIVSACGGVAPASDCHTSSGWRPISWSSAYPATKGAIVAFTRFLAAHWGEAGVRVNVLSPGDAGNDEDWDCLSIQLSSVLVDRVAIPTDHLSALVFLASDASSYITGTDLVAGGGWVW